MGYEFINDILQPLAVFGGIAVVIWVSAKARLMHRIQDMKERQMQAPQVSSGIVPPNDAVLQEMRALSAKVGEMQNTSHQFDLAFDATLERMEARVARLETKAATAVAVSPDPTILRNGTNTTGE